MRGPAKETVQQDLSVLSSSHRTIATGHSNRKGNGSRTCWLSARLDSSKATSLHAPLQQEDKVGQGVH
jgi:hypothetical protein